MTSVSSATVKSGRGLPGEFKGKSNKRVKAVPPVLGEVLWIVLDGVSSLRTVESRFLSPGDKLGEAVKTQKTIKRYVKVTN